MALGKIKADTLEHSTAGSLDTQYVVNGSAKAWIHLWTGTVLLKFLILRHYRCTGQVLIIRAFLQHGSYSTCAAGEQT